MLDHPLKQWLGRVNKGEDGNKKIWISREQKELSGNSGNKLQLKAIKTYDITFMNSFLSNWMLIFLQTTRKQLFERTWERSI